MAARNLAQVQSKARKKVSGISVSDLAHVGPGTPAGEWLRCYWLVVGTTEELRDIPVGVKILGEELVLFRDLNGRIGLVGLHCPHRGSSLEYGEMRRGAFAVLTMLGSSMSRAIASNNPPNRRTASSTKK